MIKKKWINNHFFQVFTVAIVAFFLSSACFSGPADWKSISKKIVKEHNLQGRIRNDIPETNVVSNLEPGVVSNLEKLPITEIAPGAKARMYWGKGNLINWMTLEPNAEIPREILPSERLMFIIKGSVDQLINGAFVTM
ncbi:MAG: hypothetical protein IBX60_08640, partial [Candidatus Aminicenantes bacterium]|nr:hypothetical protein [Candidatus Aminicenantes bacterium]